MGDATKQWNLRKTLLGFRPDDVMTEVERIQNEYASKLKAQHAMIDEGLLQRERLTKEIDALQQQQQDLQHRESQIALILIQAQEKKRAMEAQAKQEADRLIAEAQALVDQKRAELNRLKKQHEQFVRDFQSLIRHYQQVLPVKITTTAKPELLESRDDVIPRIENVSGKRGARSRRVGAGFLDDDVDFGRFASGFEIK
ncbi:hypothetical protein [Heliophilum fasciatum]|uniref:DivIVA protein n=1 Tax=Heliophilum fasciatum TaxID=35700 RepID=A0A4V2SWI5_9FIRM|nr:hypothetical protein [Heliophilum fasciatum]MCW2278765.1 chromosome segregation ATPase [Heliophilum fasciatum]TCP62436.1 hypothetical protein EDD73_1226 [Heliophilum fasciatum]